MSFYWASLLTKGNTKQLVTILVSLILDRFKLVAKVFLYDFLFCVMLFNYILCYEITNFCIFSGKKLLLYYSYCAPCIKRWRCFKSGCLYLPWVKLIGMSRTHYSHMHRRSGRRRERRSFSLFWCIFIVFADWWQSEWGYSVHLRFLLYKHIAPSIKSFFPYF